MSREQLINTFLSVDSDMYTGGKAKEKLNKIFDLMEQIIRDTSAENINDSNDISLYINRTMTVAKDTMIDCTFGINSVSSKIVQKLRESDSEE